MAWKRKENEVAGANQIMKNFFVFVLQNKKIQMWNPSNSVCTFI